MPTGRLNRVEADRNFIKLMLRETLSLLAFNLMHPQPMTQEQLKDPNYAGAGMEIKIAA